MTRLVPSLSDHPHHDHQDPPDHHYNTVWNYWRLLITIQTQGDIISFVISGSVENSLFQAPISLLRDLILGDVIPCCGPRLVDLVLIYFTWWDVITRYNELRTVNNKACVSRPELIVRTATTEDVAIAVNFARRNGLQFSVRSGGHSYTCTNIRDGGLHIDLRRLRKVELVETSESGSGYAALLGTGNTWGEVLRVLPVERWSMSHGQCPSVGVGGFLLGGGVNWLGTYNKYGYGWVNSLSTSMCTGFHTIKHILSTLSWVAVS